MHKYIMHIIKKAEQSHILTIILHCLLKPINSGKYGSRIRNCVGNFKGKYKEASRESFDCKLYRVLNDEALRTDRFSNKKEFQTFIM